MINTRALAEIVREAISLAAFPVNFPEALDDAAQQRFVGGLDASTRAIAFTVGGEYHGKGWDRAAMDKWSALLAEIRAVIATPGTDAERATAEILQIAEQITGEPSDRPRPVRVTPGFRFYLQTAHNRASDVTAPHGWVLTSMYHDRVMGRVVDLGYPRGYWTCGGVTGHATRCDHTVCKVVDTGAWSFPDEAYAVLS